jgi:Alternative complex III, ActD subunit
MNNPQQIIHGLLAEFENPVALLTAAARMRDSGYSKFDCHSPFPIHGMDEAMGLKRSPLGYIVFVVAAVGLAAGVLLEWWTSTVAYPLVISGKPFFSYQAYGPVAFAVMVLTSSFTALIGMLVLNRLPRYFHHLFQAKNFEKITNDGFFISVEKEDPHFDVNITKKLLADSGAISVEVVQSE